MIRTETPKQKEAFEYYVSLDKKRSCSKVAEEFQVSQRTIFNWSKWFNWQERIKLRDIQNGKKLEEKTDETLVEAKTKYLNIIQDTLQEYKQALKSGDIKINSVQDLERLVRLEMSLRHEEATDEDKVINIVFKRTAKNIIQVDDEDKAQFEHAGQIEDKKHQENENRSVSDYKITKRPKSPYNQDNYLDNDEEEENDDNTLGPYGGLIG